MVYVRLVFLGLIAALCEVTEGGCVRRCRPGEVAPVRIVPAVPSAPCPGRRYERTLEEIVSKLINALIYTTIQNNAGSGGDAGGSGGGTGGSDGGTGAGGGGSTGGIGGGGSGSGGSGIGSSGNSAVEQLAAALLALDVRLGNNIPILDVEVLPKFNNSSNSGGAGGSGTESGGQVAHLLRQVLGGL